MYQKQGDESQADQTFSRAAEILPSLTNTMEDYQQRTSFLSAPLVKHVLEHVRFLEEVGGMWITLEFSKASCTLFRNGILRGLEKKGRGVWESNPPGTAPSDPPAVLKTVRPTGAPTPPRLLRAACCARRSCIVPLLRALVKRVRALSGR